MITVIFIITVASEDNDEGNDGGYGNYNDSEDGDDDDDDDVVVGWLFPVASSEDVIIRQISLLTIRHSFAACNASNYIYCLFFLWLLIALFVYYMICRNGNVFVTKKKKSTAVLLQFALSSVLGELLLDLAYQALRGSL